MREYTDEELEDNALGLKHRELGLFDQVVNDVTVDHPDTKAYYDGRKGIDYSEMDGVEPAGPTLKNYITPAGLQRLKDEHVFLLRRERPAVVEVVAWAASNADRSENADYLYGKRRLGQIDSRIRFLTKRIDAAVVVDPAAPRPGAAATRVFFGATVTYTDAAGLEHVVSIVGIDEVDLDRGYISWRSPLANALMKASPGDHVDLRAPAKTEHLEIIEVEYAPIPMDPFREPLGAQSTPKVERS